MIRGFRATWAVLIWLFIICIPIQFYLAGHGAFEFHNNMTTTARDDAWTPHAALGTLLAILALLSLLAAFAARLSRRLLGLNGGLLVAMIVQMVLGMLGDSLSTRWLAALHPVNALIVTGLAVTLAIQAREYLPGRAGSAVSDSTRVPSNSA